ncbi:hypothetical protein ONS95_002180 [Cadophora gregata]|uniref:uncharacterized protein n=1 Tax=Cadophora gregata TaxID=51156 RepID=UPI0026DC2525|nr:uncharacterized protein ONS95_002180 [Cadophora gregata]KAK0109488.1 hypothetical protein ONS95_002180 [Cadophora gregata]KAK0110884.1 hypothetical protein ONS96_002470 [Cadophora gregata f. sp. sojae]
MPTYKDYDRLSKDSEEGSSFLDDNGSEGEGARSRSVTSFRTSYIMQGLITITALLVGGVIGYNLQFVSSGSGLAFADISRLEIYDEVAFPPISQRFNGSLFKRSAFSGPPSPAMDQSWDRYTEIGSVSMPGYQPLLNVSTEDALRSTGWPLETVVHLNETQNMGYMASVAMFHQTHCLNMLRKFIYLDYYQESEPRWFNQPLLRAHADHCVDMLRQSIMCHGDTSLIIYHWVDGYSDPIPDFSTMVRSWSNVNPTLDLCCHMDVY